jgi:hypothetical protein
MNKKKVSKKKKDLSKLKTEQIFTEINSALNDFISQRNTFQQTISETNICGDDNCPLCELINRWKREGFKS